MQATPSTLGAQTRAEHADRDLVDRIKKSEIYRTYQRAFESATGLPLTLRAAGSFDEPLHGSKHPNAFCAMMTEQNKTCAACLQHQQRMETAAHDKAATLECFAGLSDSAVPVRVGERVVAFLQTGQILLRKPTERRFQTVARELNDIGAPVAPGQKQAYFDTPVVTTQRHQSILQLLAIFAEHLSLVSNQLMVAESASESPTIAKARIFIEEHLGEELSLGQAARAAGMSVYYFCKVFKKEKGLTFTEYLARLRVEAVKTMLLNPHKRISEAAYDAGFQSLSQFNRVFRHFAGESPSNFRDTLHAHSAGTLPGSRLTHAA